MTPHVRCSGVKARVKLPGRAQRRGSKKNERLELVGRRLGRRCWRKFMEAVKEDMELVLEKEGLLAVGNPDLSFPKENKWSVILCDCPS